MADEKTIPQAEYDAAISNLNSKVDELTNKYAGAMDDLKKAQRELRSAKEITPETHQAEVERADKAEQALTDATKQVKTLTGERDSAVKALSAETGLHHETSHSGRLEIGSDRQWREGRGFH